MIARHHLLLIAAMNPGLAALWGVGIIALFGRPASGLVRARQGQ